MVRRRRSTVVALGLLALYLTCMWMLYQKAMKGRRKAEQSGIGKNGCDEAGAGTNIAAKKVFEAQFHDSTVEEQLPAAFQAILRNYSIVPLTDVKIVLVVTYYRAGSSFLGELLSAGPRTYFHFEPLMLFTVSGRIRSGRERHAFKLIEQLLRCRMEDIPLYTAWLETNPYYKFNHFLSDACNDGQSCTSPSHMSAVCLRAGTQVFKFTRLYIRQVTAWLKRNPDIARLVRVLHLVRDPRGTYQSRRGLKWCTQNAECDKASALCTQMRTDLEDFGELTRLLPVNRTHRLRFEDLALDPVNETKALYARLGLEYTPSVALYLANHTKATRQDMKNAHATKRNTHDVPDLWKKKLSRMTIGAIEEACSDVMKVLGYKFKVHDGADAEVKTQAVSEKTRIFKATANHRRKNQRTEDS